MAEEQITIEMNGSEEDGGDVRFSEFIQELTAVQAALRHTESLISPRAEEREVVYRVIDLSHSSPCRVRIGISPRAPVYDKAPRRLVRRFAFSLRAVRSRHRYAERLDPKTLAIFTQIAKPLEKKMESLRIIPTASPEVKIDKEFGFALSGLLGGDERERDEIVGRLEKIDLHNKNQFDIFPCVGAPRISCTFPSSLRSKVIKAIGHNVSVDGWALYRKNESHPFAMRVEEMEVFLPDEALPKITDFLSLVPDGTDGQPAEDFVRKFRDANW